MSAPHNDAVLDRVLTRIVSVGNQKANPGRSPRGFSSVLQRDGSSARGNIGADKRRTGSTAKFYANYRINNPAFGSSSTRDSSLAGTNTAVPQFVFAKGILRAPASSSAAPQQPSAANSGTTIAGPTNSGAGSTASTKAPSVILRQQQQQQQSQRNISSPQGHLRASRCSSPPLDIRVGTSGGGILRRSSPTEARSSDGGGGTSGGSGVYLGGGTLRGGCSGAASSPRAASHTAAGANRSRSSPRERQSSGFSADGFRGRGSADGGLGLLAAVYGGPGGDVNRPTGDSETATSGNTPSVPVAEATRGLRPGNTITRTAALRALKQQRSTTPDIIAELREVAALKATAQHGECSTQATAAHLQLAVFPSAIRDPGGPANAGGASTSTWHQHQRPHQQYRVGDGNQVEGLESANADTGGLALRGYQGGGGAGAGSSRVVVVGFTGPATDTSPHPPPHPPSQLQCDPAQKRAAPHESHGHVQKQPKQQHEEQAEEAQHKPSQQVQQTRGHEPSAQYVAGPSSAGLGPGAGAATGVKLSGPGVGNNRTWPGSGATALPGPPQPTSASSVTASRDGGLPWDINEEPSFRSPSPRRTKGPIVQQTGLVVPQPVGAIPVAATSFATANGAAAATVAATAAASQPATAAVAQRQQRAMRQHVRRQTSLSPPGRRSGFIPGTLLTDKSTTAVRASLSPQPHPNRPRSMSLEIGSWQNDVVMAAQTRIRRLEEQVVSLSAQVAELQASHADLEFQLEEEQEHGRAAAAAAGRNIVHGNGGGGSGTGSVNGGGKPGTRAWASASQVPDVAQARAEEREQQLQEQLRQLQEQLQSREKELDEQVTRARATNDGLAKQNLALYSTLEETLSAAEHAAQELKLLRMAHTQLQDAHESAQKEASQLKEDLDLRERALSAVQAEFSALRRRHEEMVTAAEASRRDNALRDGRLRREVEAATQEAAALAAQLGKLQREHQQLHSRKAEKDRQLAALAKRADMQQEQLAGAERLAQEQAALVRELESRATLLRNRNTALDRAVVAEKEARQAAQEQVRQMEEEIALLVSIVRQSDPNLETLARYKRDPAAAAAMAAAAAAAAAAALLQASPSPSRADPPEGVAEGGDAEDNGPDTEAVEYCTGVAAGPPPPKPQPYGGARVANGGRRQPDPHWHSVVTITAAAGLVPGSRSTTPPPLPPPLPFVIPGSMALSVRAPPPGSMEAHRTQRHPDVSERPEMVTGEGPEAAGPTAIVTAILQPSPRPEPDGESPCAGPDPGSARFQANKRLGTSREGSPLAVMYPAKHNMTGGVFLELGGHRGGSSSTPRGLVSPAKAGRAMTSGGACTGVLQGGVSNSPHLGPQETRLVVVSAGGAGAAVGSNVRRNTRTSPLGRRASSAGLRGGRRSDAGGSAFDGAAAANNTRSLATWNSADSSGGAATAAKTAGPVWRGAGALRRSATPPGTSTTMRGRDNPVGSVSAGSGVAVGRSAARGPAASDRSTSATTDGTGGGGGDAPPAAAVSPMEAVQEASAGDRVLWAKPRRSVRSMGSSGTDGSSGGGSTTLVPAPDPRVAPPQQQELGYSGATQAVQRTAQRALEASALTGQAVVSTGTRNLNHNRSRSCSAVEWARPRAATLTRGVRRRARTPEPRTAAAWLKLAEEGTAAAPAMAGSRKRYPTPNAEISSTGRGSYKLGPPLPSGAMPATATQEGQCSDAAAELAALLQQQQTGPRFWAGSRATGAKSMNMLAPHNEEVEAELGEEEDEEQFVGGGGPAKRSRISGGCSDSCVAFPAVFGSTTQSSGEGAAYSGSGDDGGWSVGLDNDSKTEMASPIKVALARRPRQSTGHSQVDELRNGCGPLHGSALSPTKGRSIEGGDTSSSPCRVVEARGALRGVLERSTSIIRSSYAFDSPLHRKQQQQQQLQGRQGELRQSLGVGEPSHEGQPAAAAAAVSSIGSDNDGGEVDPLGAVLRTLQQRQIALLKELAGGGDGGGGGVASPSAIVKSPLRGSGTSLRHLQLLSRSSAPAVDSPTVSSFTFANPNPTLLTSVAVSEQASEERSGGVAGCSRSMGWEAAAQVVKPLRRRSVSFPDEGASSDEGEGRDPHYSSGKDGDGAGSSGSGNCQLLSQSVRSSPGPRQAVRQPTPPPPPPPPRSPHRPSVAAAAAAAAAAGAGVGGPLSALLDQLEHSGNTWRGGSGPAEATSGSGFGSGSGSLRQSIGSGDGGPLPSSPSPLPSQQQHNHHPQQVMTHFSVPSVLRAAVRKSKDDLLTDEDFQDQLRWRLQPRRAAELYERQDAITHQDTVRRTADRQPTVAMGCGGRNDDDDEAEGSGIFSPRGGDEAIGASEGGDVRFRDVGGDEVAKLEAVSPRTLRLFMEAQSTARTADVDCNIAAAAPPSPQPRDERSVGGSELYPDEDYPQQGTLSDAESRRLISRLGVSLYDNIAYDLSRAASARADYDASAGAGAGAGAGHHHHQMTWRSSPGGPAICVPTSLIGSPGGGRGGGRGAGVLLNSGEGSEAAAVFRAAAATLEPVSPELRSNTASLQPLLSASGVEIGAARSSSNSSVVAATVSGTASTLLSTSSHLVSFGHQMSYKALDQPSLGLERAVWERLEKDEEGQQSSMSTARDTRAAAMVMAAAAAAAAAAAGRGAPQKGGGGERGRGESTSAEEDLPVESVEDLALNGISYLVGGSDSGVPAPVHGSGGAPATAEATDIEERHLEATMMVFGGSPRAALTAVLAAETRAAVAGETTTIMRVTSSAEDFATVPVTPLQASAIAHDAGGSLSKLSLPMSSSSSQPNTAPSIGGAGGTGSYSRPVLGSWWMGRAEPTLLDRQFQQHMGLLSMARTGLGNAASSSIGAATAASATPSATAGATSGSGTGSTSQDWLQLRRPASPSVKPLSLAEVLRRPPSNSSR